MISLRQPGRSPLVRAIARVLILALGATLTPLDLSASIPSGTSELTRSAFGELLAHTGADPQPYAFTGEPLDLNSGWQYHRARWMDPSVGRFVSEDPLLGRVTDPPSLHRHLYAHGSPLDRIDPSGEETLVVSNQAAAMIATLAVASLAALHAARTTSAEGLVEATTGAAVSAFELGSYAVQRAVAEAEIAVGAIQRSLHDLIEEAKERVQATYRTVTRAVSPKVVPIPAAIIPAVADHVAAAQLSHPIQLTRTDRAQARINRRNALRYHTRAGTLQSLDEYPFASSLQGGFGASVRPVPLRENRVQGGIIAASYVLQGITPGVDFFVVVIP
jgi:RHS repeat-associated protein